MKKNYIHDPIDNSIVYAKPFTVAIGMETQDARDICYTMFKGKGIQIFDPYRDASLLLPKFFDVPAFFRFIDRTTYFSLEDKIKLLFQVNENKVPLVVYGMKDDELYHHPAIFNGTELDSSVISKLFFTCRDEAKQ